MKKVLFNKCGLLVFLALTILCFKAYSQGFKIKEFRQNINDGSAFNAPMDAEGHPCGLIKIRTDNTELQFKGDIVGDVENKMNEYWVFMSPNSHSLQVNHPNFLPFVVSFSNFGIEISSKATYLLTLEEIKYKKEKTGVTLIVKPESANLHIDEVFVDNLSGNGFYQLYLPKGEHVFKLSKLGYRPNVQVVQTGKGTQSISVDLESVMAEIEIKCKSATAEIFVDGELKGNGTWKGELLAGEHKIEARQKNFNTHSQIVTLTEMEKKDIVIPELKRSMGKLRIETEPSNLPIIIDGKTVGTSPCTVDVESGKHYVSCKSYGCVTSRSDVEVNGGDTKTATFNILFENSYLKEVYQNAYHGNLNSVLKLVIIAGYREDYDQALFWINRHPNKDYLIEHWCSFFLNGKTELDESDAYGWHRFTWIEIYSKAGYPEKALELYPIVQADVQNCGVSFSSDLQMMYIGDAFLKKKEYDKAIQCYKKADEWGFEGLGYCYEAKGDKQHAATYYKKWLNSTFCNNKQRIEKKLKELGF